MKVFVVGATGYVGAHVAGQLIAAGHDVTGLTRNKDGVSKLQALGARPHPGDIADLTDLIGQASEADATIFAPQLMQEEEHGAVHALLSAYKNTGKTFIFTSGTGVLGQRTLGEWSDDIFAEDDDFIPCKYIQRRRHTELMTRAASQDGVRAMVVRPPAIWGHGRHSFLPSLLHSVEKTGKVCYIGRGLDLYSHVHIDDVADLFQRVLERGTAGALYHATAGEMNNRVLAECLSVVLGVETQSVTPAEAFDLWDSFTVLVRLGVSSRSRSPRSRRELGWAPVNIDLAQEILDGGLTPRRNVTA